MFSTDPDFATASVPLARADRGSHASRWHPRPARAQRASPRGARGARCVKKKETRRNSEGIGRRKAVEKTGRKRPWKSLRDFHFSHSFNNKLDDGDHFSENPTAQRRFAPRTDRIRPGTVIGIRAEC